MNILIPDSWLRDYLKTKATPKQLKEYLSLCGPSVERINIVEKETIYDIEVTGNRPDSMSVVGIAREAAAILPRFGIEARLVRDPYALDTKNFVQDHQKEGTHKLSITTDTHLNPRWTSIVISNVKVGPSPKWLQKRLNQTGIRSLNNVIDITNYLMRAYGQPAHAFDYDSIRRLNGIPAMNLRASRKGEVLVTLDGKKHVLPGSDIVIEDGEGKLIDLCGIMGGENSSIKPTTTTVILFMQTYNPANIRRTSMALAHRTEAAGLFEKGLDSELVLPTIMTGVDMMEKFAKARVASKLYDIYPASYKPYSVSVAKAKLTAYLGTELSDKEIISILRPLGFTTTTTKIDVTVSVPSFRRDVILDVDIIEEVARIYGYHEIAAKLPGNPPPMTIPDPELTWEQEIKIRLRDWGYTELYTYSMISAGQMDLFGLDKTKSYKIANPLSGDWVYMRPSLWPSVLTAVGENLRAMDNLRLFELSQTYMYQKDDLPIEKPTLLVALTGHKFLEAKGLAAAIFSVFGVPLPANEGNPVRHAWSSDRYLRLGAYGTVSEVSDKLLNSLGITKPVTILHLYVDELVKHAHPIPTYTPVPKFPPAVEDLAFTVPDGFAVGPLMESLQECDRLVYRVTFLDAHKNTRTFHIEYLDKNKNLTSKDTTPVREKLIALAMKKFGVELKSA